MLTGKLNKTYFNVKLHLEINTSVSSRKVTVKIRDDRILIQTRTTYIELLFVHSNQP